MNLQVRIGVAKVAKYASQESGDTFEIIERPQGGLSAVLVDGQRSGRSAKIISNIVARKAISLLGEGVRDGAVARAAHDYLRTHRGGQVSAELQVVSVDLRTRTIVISRNTQCPAWIIQDGQLELFDVPTQPIGIYPNTKPAILELPLQSGMYVVAYTDGLISAGGRTDCQTALIEILQRGASKSMTAQDLANELLDHALQAEQGRPKDDMSVLVVALLPMENRSGIRRFSASFPV